MERRKRDARKDEGMGMKDQEGVGVSSRHLYLQQGSLAAHETKRGYGEGSLLHGERNLSVEADISAAKSISQSERRQCVCL